ncbi:MAG: YbaY family lipoprotein, partial [Xanthomonadales bacterium]|nr:YbaY family lipoprotein [Xanthomonadales bacterium]
MMRNYLLPTLATVVLVVAGCSASNSPDGSAQAPKAAQVTAISGTVSLRNPSTAPTLTSAAKMTVSLVDISRQPAQTVASNTVAPVASLPIHFTLPFTPSEIMPADLYLIKVVIVDGQRHYTMPLQQLVLTKDHKTTVEIELLAQATPSEKMLNEFKEVKALLGGMKVSQGSALGSTISRAWQTFRKGGELKFVRGVDDLLTGDKGRIDSDYSYKDGKPWVVVQRHLASANAHPSSIDRAGWDSDGKLVLREREVNGSVTKLDDAAAAQLRK